MTNRRWVSLLGLLAVWTVLASGLPVLAGEITASAAKVFLTAAKADEKPDTIAPIPTTAPAPSLLPGSSDAHSAAAVPPTLEGTAAPTMPNVLRPTAAQQEARVTPTADDAAGTGAKSSRRAPTSLPLPTLSVPQTAATPTLAPPKPLDAATPDLSPTPSAAPILVAEKSAAPQELKPAFPAPAVTNKIEGSTPSGQLPSAAPALLAPATSPVPAVSTPIPAAEKSNEAVEPSALPSIATKEAAPADEHSFGFDPMTGKTYRNLLRGGATTNVPVQQPTPAPAPTPASTPTLAPTPAAKPQVVELTPSFEPETKPVTQAPAIAAAPINKPAFKELTAPPATATTVPPKVQSLPARTPTSVATDLGTSRPATLPSARPNAMLNGDEPTTQRAVVSKAPAQAESKKLFESQVQLPPLTAEQEALRQRVQRSLATYYQNWTLNTREHSPWEVMHAIIAYGVDTRLETNSGSTTTAIGHLCFSGVCNKQAIVTVRNGRLYMNRGPGVQGHAGQFLAIVAQSQLQRDYPLYAAGREFTMEDLIRAEQYDCESGTELTFKLIGLMHYLPSDAEWTNFQGQKWSMDRLVREEIVQPIRGAACGGTHRLMGLSYAVRKREQRGEPIVGIYKEAEKYIAQYHKYTRGLQNPDGSFSTAWFVRREARLDLDRRLQTTGHILEWLCFSLSDEQLREPWVTKTVTYVTNLLLEENHEWEIGHLGHALHALQMYNERMYGGPIRSYEGMVSRRPIKTAKQATPSLSNQ